MQLPWPVLPISGTLLPNYSPLWTNKHEAAKTLRCGIVRVPLITYEMELL